MFPFFSKCSQISVQTTFIFYLCTISCVLLWSIKSVKTQNSYFNYIYIVSLKCFPILLDNIQHFVSATQRKSEQTKRWNFLSGQKASVLSKIALIRLASFSKKEYFAENSTYISFNSWRASFSTKEFFPRTASTHISQPRKKYRWVSVLHICYNVCQ